MLHPVLDGAGMKSLMAFLFTLLEDIELMTRANLSRDRLTISDRVGHEGISFLTITLPAFCDGFHQALARGSVLPTDFPGFRRSGRSGVLPAFLQGLLSGVFDVCGTLRSDVSIDSILCIRQICLVYKKMSLPCTPARERKAIDGYVTIERDLEVGGDDNVSLRRFTEVSAHLWPRVLMDVENIAYHSGFTPRHGPGGNADRVIANAKYDIKYWHRRLDDCFPAETHVIANEGYYQELQSLRIVEPEREKPVKVITVPKTLKGPRIIAMEPLCMQYAQQGILSELTKTIESCHLTKPVRFTDQYVNRKLATESSHNGFYATVDLKEASDRVSLVVVERMLANLPHLLRSMKACRSTTAQIPNGEIIALKKWASMGSALCFPVLAMTVYTAIVTAVWHRRGRTIADAVAYCGKHTAVYGDDIIVPVHLLSDVYEHLAAIGLKVNVAKSFGSGKFRESCGMDAYDGYDVTPTYIRRQAPANVTDVSSIIHYVDVSNSFYKRGFWRSAEAVKGLVESILGPLPLASGDVGYLHWTSFGKAVSFSRYGGALQERLVRAWRVSPRKRKSVLNGQPALLKWFISRGKEPLDVDHLTYGGRPVALRLKLQWTGAR